MAALVGRSVNADSKVGFFWCVSEQAQFGQLHRERDNSSWMRSRGDKVGCF